MMMMMMMMLTMLFNSVRCWRGNAPKPASARFHDRPAKGLSFRGLPQSACWGLLWLEVWGHRCNSDAFVSSWLSSNRSRTVTFGVCDGLRLPILESKSFRQEYGKVEGCTGHWLPTFTGLHDAASFVGHGRCCLPPRQSLRWIWTAVQYRCHRA